MTLLNRATGLGAATCACWALSLASVGLAFLGPERSGELMSRPALLGLNALFCAVVAYSGLRAATRRAYSSALVHLGCACVVGGWLYGQLAARAVTQERPLTGQMAMVAGDVSDKLWDGPYLTNYVGKLPFTVRLERFFVERYERDPGGRDEGREAPVREYRSRVSITEPGREPYVANVRVNHPVRVGDYWLYQMSWGQSADLSGRPVTYTVLQVIRDPGLIAVYVGFVVLLAGLLLFCARVFRAGAGPRGGAAASRAEQEGAP